MQRRRAIHREVFFAANGFGPYPCYGCDEEIKFTDVFHVHHTNCNDQDNRPENLRAIHPGCHAVVHTKMRRGWDWTPRQRRTLEQYISTVVRCNDCGMTSRIGPIGRHQKASGHSGTTIVEKGTSDVIDQSA